jgi:hypothetical protein
MRVEFTRTQGLPELNLLSVAVATLGVAKVKLASVRAWAVDIVGARTMKDQMIVRSRVGRQM